MADSEYKHFPLHEVILVKSSSMTYDMAKALGDALKRIIVHVENFDDLKSIDLDELQALIDQARADKLKDTNEMPGM